MRFAAKLSLTPSLTPSLTAVLAVGVLAGTTRAHAQANPWTAGAGTAKGGGHYADVNGIRLYYEIRGSGRPLVLLHGGLGALDVRPQSPGPRRRPAGHRRRPPGPRPDGRHRPPLEREIHGRRHRRPARALGDRPRRRDGLLPGGGVALQTAIRHPAVVGKLVVVSTPFRRDAFYPGILAQQGQVGPAMAEAMKQTPMYQLYQSLAPRPEDWARLLDKIGVAMKEDFDFSADIAAIQAATLVVAGDADIFPPAHAVELFGLLGGGKRDGGWDGSGRPKSRLAILPGLTHYTIFNAPALASAVIPFLDEPAPKSD